MSMTARSSTVELANRLSLDIRERGLQPGDTYLTASEAGMLLNVSKSRANRALQLLAARRTLQRSRGAAPVVADPPRVGELTHSISRIHIFIPKADITAEGVYSDGCMVGLQQSMPEAHLHLNFYPDHGDGQFTREIINNSAHSNEMTGIVLVRSSIEAQLAVVDSGLPAVIHGTPYPGVEGIAAVDRDYVQAARLHIEYLRSKGCRRFMLLMHDRMYAGGFVFLDALRDEFADQGISSDAVKQCFVPTHEAAVRQVIGQVALADGDHPDLPGVVAFGGPLADLTLRAMEALQLKIGRDLILTYGGYYATGPASVLNLPHEQAVLTAEQQGALVGRLLQAQADPSTERAELVRMEMRFVEA
ncbi:MAG: hypothetical protein IT445_16245 [Phycisphaeraceae bacterium]|nr:hypothetical protein [Phycisphaeraceae bacterium]